MDSFKLLIEKFDETLRKYNLPNYKKLSLPLNENEIDTKLKELKITDEDFKTLYLWKNGYDSFQNSEEPCQIFDRDTFLSLNAVIHAANTNKKLNLWEEYLIPIITDTTGQYILFNNKKKDYGKLYFYSSSILIAVDTISYYDSLSKFIETTIKAYELGVLKYEEYENWLDIDIDKYYPLAKKNNKDSKFWYT